MVSITNFSTIDLTGILVSTLTVIVPIVIIYFKQCYKYWENLNVVYIKPIIPFGNTKDIVLLKRAPAQVFGDIYMQFKRLGAKFGGLYSLATPFLILTDPELIKTIMVRDFQHFTDRLGHVDEKGDPLSVNLLNLKGQKWKELRAKLTPTFTSGKIKFMFQTLLNCSELLNPVLEELKDQPIDIKELVARYTTDVIGSCAFGVECNSLKDPHSEFRKVGKMALEFPPLRAFKRLALINFPKICNFLGITVTVPYVNKFFKNIVEETLLHREENKIVRKDFIDLMIQLKNKGGLLDEDSQGKMHDVKSNTGEGLTMTEIIGQSFLFFAAGFETSSTALTFCLFELTQNLKIQNKLRQEINAVLAQHDGIVTYESLFDMKYMENVINETFRKHPPVPQVARACTKNYTIPGTNVTLQPGMRVFIPIYGLHRDPDHYPNPEVFDPDRFTEENKKTRHPFTHLPFGLRFGMVQIKVGLIVLLKNHFWTLSPDTKLPLKMKVGNTAFLYTTEGTIWLQAEKL